MPELQSAVCILFLAIAPLAGAGLALVNAGLGRSRNAAHNLMAALCVTAVAAVAYLVFGRAVQGFAGLPAYALNAGGRSWNWIGAEPLFFGGLSANGSPAFLAAWMGMVSVCITGLIPLGSASGRWRLSAMCASTGLLSALTFPLFAHWAWGGGWLAEFGYVDPGGAGTIQTVGGLTALSMTWILGPRRGKYGAEGMPMAIPGHDAVLVLFGCMLAGVGWLGLNSAGALLFAGVGTGRIALIAVNTILSASGGAIAAALITRVRYRKPDASLTANGWTGGLVASSAVSAFVPPAAALLIGLVAGALLALSVEILDIRLEVDDPGGSIPVHALSGVWGLLGLGLFGPSGHMMAQIVGIATLAGFVLPLTYGLNWLLNLVVKQRVTAEGEHQGMDLYELGAGAYPEFMTHSDDFMQR